MAKNIPVPDIGDFKDVEIIEVLVKPGDKIKKTTQLLLWRVINQAWKSHRPLKENLELKVKIGDRVSEGSILAILDGGDQKK